MKKAILIIAGAVLCLLVYYFSSRSRALSVAAPIRGPSVYAVYATGEVEPTTWAKVSSLVTAQLERFLVEEGEEVRAGQRLAILDSKETAERTNQLAAKEKLQRSERERVLKLYRARSASQEEYDRAVQSHEQAVHELAASRVSLGNYELIAPIDGRVLRRDGEIGELIAREQAVMWIGRERPLQIEAEVDEEYIPQVSTGLKAAITADAFPGKALSGTVARITPKGDPVKKSFRIWIKLPDDTPLRIGMSVEINIIAREEPNALLLPHNAALGDSVWVVAGGKAVRRRVQIGARGAGRIEILSGLTDGEKVLLDPTDQLPETFDISRHRLNEPS